MPFVILQSKLSLPQPLTHLCDVTVNAREMRSLWHEAAVNMLEDDYYPLTECRKSKEDYYAMQFHNPDTERGFFQIVRNSHAPQLSFCLRLHALLEHRRYRLTNRESGEELRVSGKELMQGMDFAMPKRSAVLWFYEAEV